MTDRDVPIGSLARASEIIGLLQTEPMGVAAVAAELDIARSTAHDHLTTLARLGYLVNEGGTYRLGLRLLDHGMAARAGYPIASVGTEVIEQLAADTGEAVWTVVEEHGRAVYVDSALGERAVPTHARVGTRSGLHYLASGKAILAHLPEEDVRAILETAPSRPVEDVEAFFEELRNVADRGYALNDNEAVEGVRAIGAPVVTDGTLRGALSLSGPANRLSSARIEDELVPELLAATNELELRLARDGPR